MIPTDEIRAKLDELGIAWVAISESATEYTQEGILYRAYETRGGLQVAILTPVTPEQAIAATVGGHTDLAKRLREVTGLRAFAELFGFKWEDGSDWTWHDVACAMADAVDAATVGAGTCDGSFHKPSDLSSGRVPLYYCKDTNRSIFVEREAKVCPLCGGRIKEEGE